jgi:hypothetical protein
MKSLHSNGIQLELKNECSQVPFITKFGVGKGSLGVLLYGLSLHSMSYSSILILIHNSFQGDA